jgi:hypothetical protein
MSSLPELPENAIVADWHPPIDTIAAREERVNKWLFYAGTMVCIGLCLYDAALVCTVVPLWPFVVAGWRFFRGNPTESPVAELMDLPPNGQQHPVSVTFKLNGGSYGSDLGVLTFAENWLLFDGVESRFTLAREHVHVFRNSELPGQERTIVLGFLARQQPYQIEVKALKGAPGPPPGTSRRFHDAADDWEWRESTVPEGPPLYPPLIPPPRLVRKLRMKGFFLMIGCLIGVAVAAFALRDDLFGRAFLSGLLVVAAGIAGFEALLRSATLHRMPPLAPAERNRTTLPAADPTEINLPT